ncbi:hypothetical protein ECZU34_41500 [Escherichia coli]|nr:hypothetical protein ECZU34_41500 [Escherichia coli]
MVLTPWYTITKPFWQKLKAVWLPYLLTMPRRFMPSRLHAAELLALEEKLARPGSDVALDDQLYQEPQAAPVAVPMGKFAMYPDWQPDADFIRGGAMGRGTKSAGDHRRTGLIHCLLAGGR